VLRPGSSLGLAIPNHERTPGRNAIDRLSLVPANVGYSSTAEAGTNAGELEVKRQPEALQQLAADVCWGFVYEVETGPVRDVSCAAPWTLP
jgi:hypothetical protein